jgi:hypothetical protein
VAGRAARVSDFKDAAELFDDRELALLRSSKPIALQVHPDGDMRVVEVRPGVVAGAVGGPQVETVTSGYWITFWFNVVEQHRHAVNRMATLHLQSDCHYIGQMI